MTPVGAPIDRLDGRAKVTGTANYSGDVPTDGMLHAVMVPSTLAKGRVVAMQTDAAAQTPGVMAVLTPFNAPRLAAPEARLTVLQDALVHYDRQPVALVVAETLQQAWHAARLIDIRYQGDAALLDFRAGFPTAHSGSHTGEPGDLSWGNLTAGLAQAEERIDALYTTPIQHHNPMEPHVTMASWDGDRLTLHDATQHITGVQKSLAKMFGIPDDHVHVVCRYVGGAFGCKGQVWSHVVLAALAARHVGRPVRLVLDRTQMFGPVGARPRTHQKVTLGATRDGRLTAIRHEVYTNTSVLEDYLESAAFPARVMYACPNVTTVSRIVPLNLGTPTYMRAPGVATGTYAVEVAMDELAYRIGVDPLELRLRNYSERDPHTQHPFSGKHLRQCYQQAAERFGWARRSMQPGSMRQNSRRVGWGMATETYPAKRLPCAAVVRLQPDGRAWVACGTQEIGNGIYTIMAQVAAAELGLAIGDVDVRIGDTQYPEGPISAGSMSTASVLPAVQAAAADARRQVLAMAVADPQSPVHGVTDAVLTHGTVAAGGQSESVSALLARHGGQPVEGRAHTEPDPQVAKVYSTHSFGAIFAAVSVDLGMVHVDRVVAVYDVGRVVNKKTAHSQFIGGIVWGISLALYENTLVDTRRGRIVNGNLADYLVPVNADIGDIEVSALDIPDFHVDPLGARGVGEIGITGTAAAVANAVFHATGKRVRDLPISPDKLI